MADEVDAYLTAIVEAARAVLGNDLVGAYAGGSLALDAYQADRSDIDIAVLCRAPLDEATKRHLVDCWRNSTLPCPAQGLELVVYTEPAARSGTTAPCFELELNDGPTWDFRQTLRPADRPASDGSFWYALDRSLLHQSGRALEGPPAAQAFTDLPPDVLRSLLIDSLQWWMGHFPAGDDPAPGAENAVLGACRGLVRQRHGVWLAKVGAGRRVIDSGHPMADVVEQAVAARSGGPPPSGAAARAFQRKVAEEITASA